MKKSVMLAFGGGQCHVGGMLRFRVTVKHICFCNSPLGFQSKQPCQLMNCIGSGYDYILLVHSETIRLKSL